MELDILMALLCHGQKFAKVVLVQNEQNCLLHCDHCRVVLVRCSERHLSETITDIQVGNMRPIRSIG